MSEAAKAAERIELLFNRVRREAWPSDPNDDALAISEDYPIKFCSTVEFKNPPTTNEVTAEIQAAIDATHSELEQLRERVRELEAVTSERFDSCMGLAGDYQRLFIKLEASEKQSREMLSKLTHESSRTQRLTTQLSAANEVISKLSDAEDVADERIRDLEHELEETAKVCSDFIDERDAANEKCERLERGIAKLDKHCLNGHYCKWQDGVLWLFDSRGEGVEMAASRLDLINKLGGDS